MKLHHSVHQQIVGKTELQELDRLHDVVLLQDLSLDVGLVVLNLQLLDYLIQLAQLWDCVGSELLAIQRTDYSQQGLLVEVPEIDLACVRVDLCEVGAVDWEVCEDEVETPGLREYAQVWVWVIWVILQHFLVILLVYTYLHPAWLQNYNRSILYKLYQITQYQ